MKQTRHAIIRKRQGRLSDLSLDIIRQYGRCERAPGGAVRFFFGNREYQTAVEKLKKTIQSMDKAKGGTFISKDGSILTAYK